MPNQVGAELLLDSSAAVALILPSHAAHAAIAARVGRSQLGLAGHAAIETYSTLTRLPAQDRLSAAAAARRIADDFPASRRLEAMSAAAAVARFAAAGITGGAVIDGLVALAAIDAGLPLVTCDRRTLLTSTALGAEVEFV
ncbi:PIN domain-containing protein [Agromyces sp. NPDC057679]|uniref:PIN domain-containing protein n=1 Tax=Agromyces sp. NPDC057679 TaxID=3346207 RepID=UPI00366BEEEC